MRSESGRSVPLSLPRRWVGDLLHFSQQVPVVAGERSLRVKKLFDARRAVSFPPSWYSLIVKGLGIASQRIPELRRSYLPYPWPRLYEHPFSVGTVTIPRVWNGEQAAFFCPILHPERVPLSGLHDKIRGFHDDPIERHGPLRRLVRTSRYPRPIRRAVWSLGLKWLGMWRAGYFGTYAVNSIAAFRGKMLQTSTPITTLLYFGTVGSDGRMDITLAFDHRVYDGYTAGKAVGELESVLNSELVTETLAFNQPAASQAA